MQLRHLDLAAGVSAGILLTVLWLFLGLISFSTFLLFLLLSGIAWRSGGLRLKAVRFVPTGIVGLDKSLDSAPQADKLRVVITGASSGIGKAMALNFSKRTKCDIVLAARREAELQEVAQGCLDAGASSAHYVKCDLSQEDDCKRLIAEAAGHLGGGIDILVLNAGVGQSFFLEQAKETDSFRRVFELNLWGQVYPAYYALPYLHQSKVGGRIAVMSSVGGYVPFPRQTLYNASKHALQGCFNSLRLELYYSGISVTMCNPGFLRTEMTDGKNAIGADGSASALAEKVKTSQHSPGRFMMGVDQASEDMVTAILARQDSVVVPFWYEIPRYLFIIWPALANFALVKAFMPARRRTQAAANSNASKLE